MKYSQMKKIEIINNEKVKQNLPKVKTEFRKIFLPTFDINSPILRTVICILIWRGK